MTCIHTGAIVYLAEYGATVRGDVHLFGTAFVVRTVPGSFQRGENLELDWSTRLGQSGQWFEGQTANEIGTLVVVGSNATPLSGAACDAIGKARER
jgi:hypothetical protein